MSASRYPKPEPLVWPATCWLCSEPALPQRAVCTHHAEKLDGRAARMRKRHERQDSREAA